MFKRIVKITKNKNRTGKIRLLFVIYYNGNLVTGDGKYRTYDGYNHLVQIRNGNNATGTILENLTWHPLEERILVKATYETNGSWKENVYYISQSFVKVKNASGTYDYKYIYQNGQLVAQEFVDEKKHFMLNDHKGTVQIVVNESGAKVEETFYSPFGEIISGGATSRFDYEGKEYDSVVGDYDYHARKVNPQWGMFTQPDTLLPNVYDPQQLNRYAFERNNPYKFVDDDGNLIQIPASLAIVLVGLEIAAAAMPVAYLAMADKYQAMAIDLGDTPLGNEFSQKSRNMLNKAFFSGSSSGVTGSIPALKTIDAVYSSVSYIPDSENYKADIDKYTLIKYNKPFNELSEEELQEFKGLTYISILLTSQPINANMAKKEILSQNGGGARRSGGSGRTSRQIAQEEVKKAEEQGGSGEYKENPNGGAQWSTVTPRKKN